MAYNTIIVLLGTSLLGACSGLVGSFAVLRRRALAGDALAHAALPGICIAFLILDQRSLPAMLAGALISGMIGMMVVSGMRRATRIKEDAAIGIVLSVFYGAGIVLSRIIQNRTTTGSKAGLESFILGKTAGMIRDDVFLIAGVSAVCLVLVLLLYKEFKVVSFDPGFSEVQGWPVFVLDLLLMAMVAVTVVIGLPAVGVVMVAALLIIPAAAARFWTEHLGTMMIIAAVFGLMTGALGTLASAYTQQLPAGPVIVLIGSAIFLVSVLFAPRRGALSRGIETIRLRRMAFRHLVLRSLYEIVEAGDFQESDCSTAELMRHVPGLRGGGRRTITRLVRNGLMHAPDDGVLRLTRDGWREAIETVRNHRIRRLFMEEYPEQLEQVADIDSASAISGIAADEIDRLRNVLEEQGRWPVLPQALVTGEA